jgi:hypothetical protein
MRDIDERVYFNIGRRSFLVIGKIILVCWNLIALRTWTGLPWKTESRWKCPTDWLAYYVHALRIWNGNSSAKLKWKNTHPKDSNSCFKNLLLTFTKFSLTYIYLSYRIFPLLFSHQVKNDVLSAFNSSRNHYLAPFDKTDQDNEPEDKPSSPHLTSLSKWIRDKYADVFDAHHARILPAHKQTDHTIDVVLGAMPPYRPLYNLSPRELKALEEFIHDRLEKGHIRESMSPAGAAVIFAPKKDGTLRLCVDYRGLNAITVKNRYHIPLISELLDRLHGAKVFSKLDLLDAYYRIRIKEMNGKPPFKPTMDISSWLC